jgi:hypothetical protein
VLRVLTPGVSVNFETEVGGDALKREMRAGGKVVTNFKWSWG